MKKKYFLFLFFLSLLGVVLSFRFYSAENVKTEFQRSMSSTAVPQRIRVLQKKNTETSSKTVVTFKKSLIVSESQKSETSNDFDASNMKVKNLLLFLNSGKRKAWKVHAVGPSQLTAFGGESTEQIVDDSKAQAFVASAVRAAGYRDLDLELLKEAKKTTSLEIIDEFSQKINGFDVYDSYVRLFRDGKNLKATDVLIDLKEAQHIDSAILYASTEVESKISDLYLRLNQQVSELSCADKNYYVDSDKNAQLSYVCKLTAGGAVPQTYELIVSAQTAKILYQKTLTIYN